MKKKSVGKLLICLSLLIMVVPFFYPEVAYRQYPYGFFAGLLIVVGVRWASSKNA